MCGLFAHSLLTHSASTFPSIITLGPIYVPGFELIQEGEGHGQRPHK